MILHPFFSYYGSKWQLAKHYPAPKYDTIIEPFAGSAGYSLHYANRKIILYDLDPVICGIWDYLIKASIDDILRLPTAFDYIWDVPGLCEEERWLIGYWLHKATTKPAVSLPVGTWRIVNPKCFWSKEVKLRIAGQVDMIRHWKIRNISYRQVENTKATWFIDPPYQVRAGRQYKINHINFAYLSKWCKEREGQSIVCEQGEANWLDFAKFKVRFQPGKKQYNQELIYEQHND